MDLHPEHDPVILRDVLLLLFYNNYTITDSFCYLDNYFRMCMRYEINNKIMVYTHIGEKFQIKIIKSINYNEFTIVNIENIKDIKDTIDKLLIVKKTKHMTTDEERILIKDLLVFALESNFNTEVTSNLTISGSSFKNLSINNVSIVIDYRFLPIVIFKKTADVTIEIFKINKIENVSEIYKKIEVAINHTNKLCETICELVK